MKKGGRKRERERGRERREKKSIRSALITIISDITLNMRNTELTVSESMVSLLLFVEKQGQTDIDIPLFIQGISDTAIGKDSTIQYIPVHVCTVYMYMYM